METVLDPPDQILEQIQHFNLTLDKSVLERKDHQDHKKIMEYFEKVTPLFLVLVKTLHRQLDLTTKILQNTCQFLNPVHDRSQKEISCSELDSLEDWLLEVSNLLLPVVEHLGQSENKLLEMSCREIDRAHESGNKAEKVQEHTQVQGCGNQLLRDPSLTHESKNGTPLMESPLVEFGTTAPLNKKESEFFNKEHPTLSEQPCVAPEKDSGEDSCLERCQENSSLEENPVRKKEIVIQKLPAEKTLAEKAENGDFRSTSKPRSGDLDVSQEQMNNNIAEIEEKSGVTSGDLHKDNSISVVTGQGEEEDGESGWMNKEFFMEANNLREPEVSCSITAPCSILEHLAITVANDLSSLVVDESEELISNVIHVECPLDGQPTVSPIIIAIPFTSRYRGMYKDVMVKLTDTNFQSTYLTPISMEGLQGNMKVQPVDPSTISVLKAKHDVYHPVVSTSPLVHLEYPSSQPFNRPITLVLPCPPNQEKKKEGGGTDPVRAASASAPRVPSLHHLRGMSASPRKHREILKESLQLLGYRSNEEGWVLLDDITVRNTRNGLVSFELDEPLDRLIIVRLSSAMDSPHLIQFIQKLERDIHKIMVKVILYRNKEDPSKIIVLLAPSKELSRELQCLHEEGYSGPPEPSRPFKMREGEQVCFKFSGNIFASDDGMTYGKSYKLSFHAQRKPRLLLQIKEVDEFGNYSAPHYKGTALFYKVTKETVIKNADQAFLMEDPEQHLFLCKLALTLPKKEKLVSRPQSTKRISRDLSEVLWDNLFYWLSEELSEENASCLALCLPLHRSTLQFIKLKCPDNLTQQIYELLCFWRRNLPRSADKLTLLSRYLCKSGRGDLAQKLQVKWAKQDFTKRNSSVEMKYWGGLMST